jgi:hypothetical protein
VEIRALLRSVALKLPDVTLGIACKGTALESTTYNSNKKAFLFVGAKDARLKRAAGWTKIDLAAPPSDADVTAWVTESHALIVGNASSKPKKKPATKQAAKKKPRAKKSGAD